MDAFGSLLLEDKPTISVASAFQKKNRSVLNRYLELDVSDYYDVYIGIDKAYKAIVLCCSKENEVAFGDDFTKKNGQDDPYKIHSKAEMLVFEVFESPSNSISSSHSSIVAAAKTVTFGLIFQKLGALFYIGRYSKTSRYALELAALEATPKFFTRHKKDVSMDFAKRFCRVLLQFCADDVELCDAVHRKVECLPSRAVHVKVAKPCVVGGLVIDERAICLVSLFFAFVAFLLFVYK